MSDTFAQSSAEELLLVAEEIAGLKSIVREVSGQLNRMERRVKTALSAKKVESARPAVRKPPIDGNASKLNDESARILLSKMAEQARAGGKDELIEERLRAMTVKGELAVIARALGLTYAKFPKSELIRMIMVKIREEALLSARYGSNAGAEETRARASR